MAKSANYKRKLPILAKLLLERSDEEHPISRQEMQEELERWGLGAERKSIYDDMEQLRELGLDVQSRRGRGGGWFVGARDFELAELKLLVDAVQSSRFLTKRKSDALIHKLEGLTSVHQARQLQRQVYVDRRVKTMNESIFYNVDKLQGAIANNKVVTFRYFEYNAKRERVFRREGARYKLTPYGLIWDSENYYLAGWDELRKEVRHYRVDKMADITVTGMKGHPQGDWTAEGYTRKHFGMYSGTPCRLRLRCENRLAGVLIDRFGLEVSLIPDGEEHFTASVDLVVSPPLWGWLFGLGPGVEVLSPGWAVDEFAARLEQAAALYRNRPSQEEQAEDSESEEAPREGARQE
ncbi:MAG: WYL domain-containing transcriptional regulator [Clostridiales bacterium]|nr:WYL domain-containing transcriptional regulator [Clostridiales bacterium]